jgi:rod shape-determining protein MreD
MTMVLAGFGSLVLATFLQLALPGGVPVWGMEPNLVLALVVAWAWVLGPRWAFAWAVLGGLLLDLSGGAPLGVHALGLLGAAYLVGLLRSVSPARAWPLTIPAGALGGAVYGGVVLLGLHVFGDQALTWQLTVTLLGGAIGSGAIVSVPFALLFTVLRRGLAQRRPT